ncbi:MAG: membrane protein insertase YidC [Hyphomicrobiales bacterium]
MTGRENREFMLAIALSALVLILWQIFVGIPTMDQERAKQEAKQQQTQTQQTQDSTIPTPQAGGDESTIPTAPGIETPQADRDKVVTAQKRIKIDTEKLTGSINLAGARIDDLSLKGYHETVDRSSPLITLLSPSGTRNAYYAEFGWVPGKGAKAPVPQGETVWTAPEDAVLTASNPVTLTYDNGAGLIFKRTVSVDDEYMFSIDDQVENSTGEAFTLHSYGLVSRHGTPSVLGFFVLHEGLVGYLGENGLKEIDYDDLQDDVKKQTLEATTGWLGITDKYWAVTLIPDPKEQITARFSNSPRDGRDRYQTDYLHDGGTVIPAGGKAAVTSHLFAGAKIVSIVDDYQDRYGINNFELLIDWGWFYFITKPLFLLLDFFYQLVSNFGIAILLVTVVIKLIFFPLANKSYVSMSKMKLLQPEVVKIRERYADDKMKQQQEMMDLYKKEKVSPMSGCLPIVIQIPVFFALYKVLFVTIEMRHAPFYGWIQDLSAPDPTSLFNLFGLIPWAPPSFLMIGVWPILMGITMFVQMRLNPPPPDPTQAMIFNWMPLFFTFLLATFPAGLIIYWAWNNFLSIIQQYVIMRRQGVKVELLDNLKKAFSFLSTKKKESET